MRKSEKNLYFIIKLLIFTIILLIAFIIKLVPTI